MTPPDRNLRPRVLAAFVLVPLFVAVAYVGRLVFLATVELLAIAAAVEFYRLPAAKPYRARLVPGVALALALPAWAYWAPASAGVLTLLLVVAVLGIALAQLLDPAGEEAIASTAVTVFGALYIGGLLSGLVLVREYPRERPGMAYAVGAALLAVPIVLTWINDTAAYAVGRRWGRRRLLPRVSPGKSVEGALGALVATIALAVPVCWGVNRAVPLFRPVDMLAIGTLVGLAAPVGDLMESLWKRDAGVKDSSALIPGHGGVLDRFDSILVTVPVFYVYLCLVAA
ncbi:MAG: phosphatidate cytidylyltransferase [Gemmatimonadota bacterium]